MSLPVVLLPGTLCDEQVWHNVVAKLGPDQEVISKPLGAYRDWKSELAHLVKDLPERFVLVGFSLGGIAALAMLHQYPERVKKLVLVASTALADPPDSQARRRELFRLAEQNNDFKQLALMQISPCDRQNMGEDGVTFAVQMAERFSVEQYACQTELACSRQDTRQCLAESQRPVHLIYGNEDTACGEDKQLLIREVCQQAMLHPVAGAGHWLPLTHPDEVAKVVLEALGPR